MPRAGLSTESVVDAAADLVDEQGWAALTIVAVASRTGVAAPSLYKHVRSLEALQQKVSARVTAELAQVLTRSVAGRSGEEALRRLAHDYRDFGLAHPGRYPLTQRVPDPKDPKHVASGNQIVQAVFAALRGYGLEGDEAIHATRVARSALHGFVILEIDGGFALRQEVGESFERLVSALHVSLAGWNEVAHAAALLAPKPPNDARSRAETVVWEQQE